MDNITITRNGVTISASEDKVFELLLAVINPATVAAQTADENDAARHEKFIIGVDCTERTHIDYYMYAQCRVQTYDDATNWSCDTNYKYQLPTLSEVENFLAHKECTFSKQVDSLCDPTVNIWLDDGAVYNIGPDQQVHINPNQLEDFKAVAIFIRPDYWES